MTPVGKLSMRSTAIWVLPVLVGPSMAMIRPFAFMIPVRRKRIGASGVTSAGSYPVDMIAGNAFHFGTIRQLFELLANICRPNH